MWKISKSLAVCIFAAAWWGIFYPELCFSEDTCAVVRTENAQEECGETLRQEKGAQNEEKGTLRQNGNERNGEAGQQEMPAEIDAADVWHALGDEIVIRSRLWEWCEEKLPDWSDGRAESALTGR